MIVASALLVIFFLLDSKPVDRSNYNGKEVSYKKLLKKDEITVMTILVFKVTMYYFQSLGQILFSKNIAHSLLPLVSLFTFSLDYTFIIISNFRNLYSSVIFSPLLSNYILIHLCCTARCSIIVIMGCQLSFESNKKNITNNADATIIGIDQ